MSQSIYAIGNNCLVPFKWRQFRETDESFDVRRDDDERRLTLGKTPSVYRNCFHSNRDIFSLSFSCHACDINTGKLFHNRVLNREMLPFLERSRC